MNAHPLQHILPTSTNPCITRAAGTQGVKTCDLSSESQIYSYNRVVYTNIGLLSEVGLSSERPLKTGFTVLVFSVLLPQSSSMEND